MREARLYARLTQAQLGERAATLQAAIARYEGGIVVPDLHTLNRLIDACGQRFVLGLESRQGRTGAETATHRPPSDPFSP